MKPMYKRMVTCLQSQRFGFVEDSLGQGAILGNFPGRFSEGMETFI